jgi:hypothetical protein
MKDEVAASLEDVASQESMAFLLCARHDFAAVWSALKSGVMESPCLRLTDDHFPYFSRMREKRYIDGAAYALTSSRALHGSISNASLVAGVDWFIDIMVPGGDISGLEDIYVVLRFGVA